ncbi:MAG: symmetrical bis(5'-nucleosyl)-tetraphosphatase [Myxococcota bacterium]
MATYAIGDIHGCLDSFERLLARIAFDPAADRLLLCGDIVNGGPDSLGALRWVFEHRDHVDTVLGNHDLHMLAVANGSRPYRDKDTFSDVLEAPDGSELLDWLRHQHMTLEHGDFFLVHAGLLPEWSTEKAAELGAEVERELRADDYAGFLERMYGNKPRRWSDGLAGEERERVIVNAMTRMRVLDRKGAMKFDYSGTLEKMPKKLTPWFEAESAEWRDRTVLFGHWSAIGLHIGDDTYALDSGCRWGGRLTALRLDDREVFQVDSELAAAF